MQPTNPANPPNEYPDIVGAKPANPILAAFKPFIPASAQVRELGPAYRLVLATGKLDYFGEGGNWDVESIALSPDGRVLAVITNEAGVGVLSSCAEGTCGTCEGQVIDGEPDHLDSVLSDEEGRVND